MQIDEGIKNAFVLVPLRPAHPSGLPVIDLLRQTASMIISFSPKRFMIVTVSSVGRATLGRLQINNDFDRRL